MTTYKNLYRNPENIGWAGCVYINADEKTILLVRNLKREAQIFAELLRQGFTTEDDQRLNYSRVRWELSKKTFIDGHGKVKKGLEKPSKWELLGGSIAYWQGNPKLINEFNGLVGDAMREFEEKIGLKVLFDNDLLERAADSTAESEYVEESGLIAKKKILLGRINDPDRDHPDSDLFYPRFWYLVTDIAGGQLREEPVKATISAPKWISLFNLHPFSDRDGLYPIHRSHVLGIVFAARHFIRNGRPEFAEAVSYLEKTFGPQREAPVFEETADWESFAKTVKKLN